MLPTKFNTMVAVSRRASAGSHSFWMTSRLYFLMQTDLSTFRGASLLRKDLKTQDSENLFCCEPFVQISSQKNTAYSLTGSNQKHVLIPTLEM
jgi:hypothetical protein